MLARAYVFLACAALGCEPASAACRVDGGACGLADGVLHACANVTTGLYGTASETCTGTGVPIPCGGCTTPTLSITSGDAAVDAQPYLGDGFYAVELPPGTYSVCCIQYGLGPCAEVTLAANQVRRVDQSTIASAGGIYCSTKAQ